jgi:hypothetical protein
MSTRRSVLLTLAVFLLLAAAVSVWLSWPKTAVVTVAVSGTRGLAVKGTAEVDGNPRDLTGTVPTEFVLEGRRVAFTLASTAEAGEFRVKLGIGGTVSRSAGSHSPPTNGARGWVKTGWGWSPPTDWLESFDRNANPGWITPPP